MNRILFSWGLGGGFAHLSRLEPMARNLRAAGYEVLFVSKDTQCAAKWLGPYGYRFLRAPVSARVYKLTMPLANYTEVLIAEGYTELAAWRGNVEGAGFISSIVLTFGGRSLAYGTACSALFLIVAAFKWVTVLNCHR